MKMKTCMLAVKDMEKAKAFYAKVIGSRVLVDLGEHVVLSGGLALQTEESWKGFIHQEVAYRGNDIEVYFEEDQFDDYLEKLQEMDEIHYVHPLMECDWGQRVIRFYDPDGHIIEVGENMKAVCQRFVAMGLSDEEIAERMCIPLRAVKNYKR